MTRRFSVPSLPFQSTLSMRRATHAASSEKHGVQISIHALHEESDPHRVQQAAEPLISIHALHEESDPSYG